jgi:acetylcholinesterase
MNASLAAELRTFS